MTFAIALAALRRHPSSAACTALLLTVSASLLGAPVPLALGLWVAAALLSLETLRLFELVVLRRLGCRPPSHLERQRLESVLGSTRVEVLVRDAAQPWLARGVRRLVVSSALLDLLEDRALGGLLTQASEQVASASLPGELMVWLGNLPVLSVWCLSRCLMQLGRLLAVVVGVSLVLPLLICPAGFTRWVGRVFGSVIVGLLGSALLSDGFAAAGLGLLLGWLVVPGLAALLAWETRRAELRADDATIAAGLGWQLLEALETLVWTESSPAPAGPLGWLSRPATPLTDRADRLWQKLSRP